MRSSSSQGLEELLPVNRRPAAETRDPALLPPHRDGDGAGAAAGQVAEGTGETRPGWQE